MCQYVTNHKQMVSCYIFSFIQVHKGVLKSVKISRLYNLIDQLLTTLSNCNINWIVIEVNYISEFLN